ncbi:MAG: hypothetical protein JNL10_02745 [Verrucomicrobiales bacterium]|nr:hypothetical protein [Verrucomicrobiales bacterium]
MKLFPTLFLLLGQLARAADDLTPLSDEFRSVHAQTRWQRLYQTEGWGNDALATLNFGQQRPGRLLMIPHTSVWYEEFRGELTYQTVTGDFVITTDVAVSRRGGGGAPRSQFSLAGIMVRTPRPMTSPAQWTPGGQNYVFLSLGAANTPGTYQHEVKTTVNSVSTLEISPGTPQAQIQVARVGRHLILLRRPAGGSWTVHRRYSRPDFPATLQAGLTVYTDWPNCERIGFSAQNRTVLTNGARLPNGTLFAGANPDLEAAFDYVRYARPNVPAQLVGADLSNPAAVSDAQLLAFLGDHAHEPAEPLRVRLEPQPAASRVRLDYGEGQATELHRLDRLQVRASADLAQPWATWRPLNGPVTVHEGAFLLEDPLGSVPAQFYRAMELP